MGPGAVADVDEDVEAEVVRVAVSITERLEGIRRGMRTLLGDAIAELVGDHRLLDLLTAAIDGNVSTVLEMLRDRVPLPQVEVPMAAVEHARRLAQQGVPVFAMVRAYRLGQGYMLEECFAELTRGGAADPQLGLRAFHAINTRVLAYIDWVSQEVVTVYETERDQWVRHQDAARVAAVHEILAGRGGDAESALRHRLRQQHVAAVLWLDAERSREERGALEAAGDLVARVIGAGAAPLTVAADRFTTWAWFPRGGDASDPDVDRVRTALREDVPAVRVALGSPGYGIDGFRASHREALDARVVLLAGRDTGRMALGHHESGVRAAALLAGDLPRTRAMVRDVLGPLAGRDESSDRLRSTLLAFLDNGSSYTATAQRLALHKNSVKYRVERALEQRGRPLAADRIDVELALVACRWLGGGVLPRPEAP